jgi:hypothetical protein
MGGRFSWTASFTAVGFMAACFMAASFTGGQRTEPDQGPVLGHPDRAR